MKRLIINEHSIQLAEDLAKSWLIHAFNKCNETGFSHSRWMFLPSIIAWNKPYPETSGYIIENFLDFNFKNEQIDGAVGIKTGNALLNNQSAKGYFYSGVHRIKPSVFNTAQILFGLMQCYDKTKEEKFFNGINLARNWLLQEMDDNGIWQNGLYVDSFLPSYYTRALWPLLLMYSNPKDSNKLENSLDHFWKNKTSNYSFIHSGFHPSDQFYLTHTIAYTIEGFIECAQLTNRKDILDYCMQLLEVLAKIIEKENGLAGKYSSSWQSCHSFKCVTGQAQFCSIYAKAFQINQNIVYKKIALRLFEELISWQITSKNNEINGAFPASIPIYGAYFPFRYVNWTNKFFLDACHQIKKIIE